MPGGRPDESGLPLRLREALQRADYTYDAVAELLGSRAHEALGRNETTPALHRTGDGSPLATLTRLFLLQAAVPVEDVERALPGLLDAYPDLLLRRTGAEVRALLDVRPYATEDRDLWVLSDLTPGLDGPMTRVASYHVLGITPASTSLAQLTIREPVGKALDLGTGCGVQALHLASHADSVVATDINARAVWAAGFNAALNGQDNIETRGGYYYAPVKDETFDLIATNPPFVISPATTVPRLVYRDSGMPGDDVISYVVRNGPAHLTDGGWLQVLANWAIHRGVPWDERLAGWVPDDCAALVVQREVLDPAAYVELWLKDEGLHGGPDYRDRYDAWLTWFDEQGVEGIGFGWINVKRADLPSTYLDWPYAVEQPIAPAVREWAAAAAHRLSEGDRLTLRVDVVQETSGEPGAEHPESIVLRQQRGLRRARQVDTVVAGFAGACDGELTVGEILDALAVLTDADPAELRATHLPVVGELLAEGFLVAPGA